MTTEQISKVKGSWRIISKIDPILLGEVFYAKLFFDNPQLRRLFAADKKAQYLKLVSMLNKIVISLDRLAEVETEIEQLAIRHRSYRVRAQHYDMVGHSLIWTFRHAMGPDFDEKLEEAWVACYMHVANCMMTVQESQILNYKL